MQRIQLEIAKTAELDQPIPSSAQIVASIDDLLIEILSRLPITSLLFFKLVSKRWFSLITNPRFAVLCHPNPNPAIGLFLPSTLIESKFDYVHFDNQNPTTKPPFNKLKFPNDSSAIDVLQSHNGLLLCCSSYCRQDETKYYVFNPTTKHYTTLPTSTFATGNSKIHGLCLAFDPAKSLHYKVVCVRDSESSPHHYQIEIYSSETGPWRQSGGPFTSDVRFNTGVYWNGSVHWINDFGSLTGLCYNLDLERLGIMPMPNLPEDDLETSINYFVESYDHLHLMKIDLTREQFDVYEMKRDYSEWFVKYKVDIEPHAGSLPGMIKAYSEPNEEGYYHMVSLVRGRREEDDFLVLDIPGDSKLMRYNLLSKTFEELYDYEGENEHVGICRAAAAFVYIQSLCCV